MTVVGTVYVVSSVTHGEQEGVVAVFATRESADHFAKSARKPGGTVYYVRAWALNVPDWRPPEERS